MSSSIVVAGVDVAGRAKGFHAVALCGGAYLDKFNSGWILGSDFGVRILGLDFYFPTFSNHASATRRSV